jgi:hypothetical protein
VTAGFEQAGQARAALRAIVSDPSYGPEALSDIRVLSNLLSDLLPDARREIGPLLAAAEADVARSLRDHVARGMDPATAVRIVASDLASRTAFSVEACYWVTGEFAVALGLTTADRLPVRAPAGHETENAEARAATSEVALGEQTTGSPTGTPSSHGPDTGSARNRSRARRRRWPVVTAGLAIVLAAAAAIVVVIRESGQAAADTAPAPRLAQFVPADQQVLHVYRVRLTASPIPQVVVTTVIQQTNATMPPEDLLLLGWDRLAKRWTLLYDAAKDPVNVNYVADSATEDYQADNVEPLQPLFPKDDGILDIKIAEIHDQPHHGADLLFTAGVAYGAGYGQVTGIIHYDGHNADLVWNYSGNGGPVKVVGAAPHQQVALTDEWNTSSDLRSFPVRSFSFVIASTKLGFTETYAAVSDSRPWLGVFVTVAPAGSTSANVVVDSVVAGSPAAGIVKRGDIITSISGPPLKFARALIGPPLIDELATHEPGDTVGIDLVRDGIPMTVRVRVSSLANPLAVNAIFPSVPASVIEDML